MPIKLLMNAVNALTRPMLPVGLVFCLVGCTSKDTYEPLNESGIDGIYIKSNAEYRNSYLIPPATQPAHTAKGQFLVLAEPPPDAVMANAVKVAGKLNYKSLSVSEQVSITQAITALGQRTEAVNVIRDSMYRISELYADGALTSNQVEKLYQSVLTAATAIAQAEKWSGAAPTAQALSAAIKANHKELAKLPPKSGQERFKLQTNLITLTKTLHALVESIAPPGKTKPPNPQ